MRCQTAPVWIYKSIKIYLVYLSYYAIWGQAQQIVELSEEKISRDMWRLSTTSLLVVDSTADMR